jgi:hypothetical protein
MSEPALEAMLRELAEVRYAGGHALSAWSLTEGLCRTVLSTTRRWPIRLRPFAMS